MRQERSSWDKTLYRSRKGMILGVCQGIADYLDFPVIWLRLALVVALFMTGFFPVVVVYFVAALLMKPEPVVPFESESDREFYESYVSSRTMAIHRLKRTYDSLDRRIRRIESIVTSRDFDWDARLRDK
jgi:phage shock protein C